VDGCVTDCTHLSPAECAAHAASHSRHSSLCTPRACQVLTRKVGEEELKDADFAAYLASESESGSGSGSGSDEDGSDDGDEGAAAAAAAAAAADSDQQQQQQGRQEKRRKKAAPGSGDDSEALRAK
jgi:hypothetical protein